MAHTAHSDAEMMKERFDAPDVLESKIDRLADLIRVSNHVIFFTGAGISTSAGIPDFRGPKGVWTLKAQGKRPERGVPTLSVYPTITHMSLVELMRRDMVHYLVSQNCDGLHRRSGIPARKISELHGNINIELCEDCGLWHYRDFGARRLGRGRDHYTGRHCTADGCNGRLLESTIDFGQSLPIPPMERGFAHAKRADLCVVLGSSCTVSPACKIPEKVRRRGGNLVIVNLQKTPLYDIASLNIHAKIDEVMMGVMQRLHIEVPIWEKRRWIELKLRRNPSILSIRALRHDEPDEDTRIPYSALRKISLKIGDRTFVSNAGEPYEIDISPFVDSPAATVSPTALLTLFWYGHHQESPVMLPLPLGGGSADPSPIDIHLTYSFHPKGWTMQHCSEYEQLLRMAGVGGDNAVAAAARLGAEHTLFAAANLQRIGRKLLSMNQKVSGRMCISASAVEGLVEGSYGDSEDQLIRQVVSSWPPEFAWPVLDLLRVLCLTDDFGSYYGQFGETSAADAASPKSLQSLLEYVMNLLSRSCDLSNPHPATAMMACRVFSNLYHVAHQSVVISRASSLKSKTITRALNSFFHQNRLEDGLNACIEAGEPLRMMKGFSLGFCGLLMNHALFLRNWNYGKDRVAETRGIVMRAVEWLHGSSAEQDPAGRGTVSPVREADLLRKALAMLDLE